MDLLTVTDLSKRFGGVRALDRAAFSARAGEVHALLGENGAGKSTFIQVLAGAVRADGGRILLQGREVSPAGPEAAHRLGIAAVFQELSLVPDLTVEQNIWFRHEPRTPWRTADRRAVARATAALLDGYGFPPLPRDTEVRRLPLAERQLCEVAKALSRDPRILILDEATSALPAREAGWLLSLSRRLAAEGRLVIFISHRMGEVRRVADRLTIFRNGATVAAHDAAAISDDEIVTRMIGRRMDRLYPERRPTRGSRIALSARGLSSGRRLRDLSFDLHEGEVLGVAGLQGQGQRELFEALFGAAPAGGTLALWGRPVTLASPREALTGPRGIALVPEDRRGQGLLLAKSVRENLTLASIRRFSRAGLLDRAREGALVRGMIEFLRIKASDPEQPAGTLSGGNQQKVVFGKMLMTEARVLLLFDPTRGVDVATKGEVFQMMRDLAGRGYAILFYSSDLAELVHVPDRVMVLRDGRVAATLEGGALTEEDILRPALLDGAA